MKAINSPITVADKVIDAARGFGDSEFEAIMRTLYTASHSLLGIVIRSEKLVKLRVQQSDRQEMAAVVRSLESTIGAIKRHYHL